MTEAQAYAKKWMDLHYIRSTLVMRALEAREPKVIEQYIASAASYEEDMDEIGSRLQCYFAHEGTRRIEVSPGSVLTLDERGEIGIEGVNKPEALEDLYA